MFEFFQLFITVNRVFNTYSRDRNNYDYLTKHIPKNGIEERLENMEVQLSLHTPVPRNVYKRLKQLENRLLYLESTSPEYIQFWVIHVIFLIFHWLFKTSFRIKMHQTTRRLRKKYFQLKKLIILLLI